MSSRIYRKAGFSTRGRRNKFGHSTFSLDPAPSVVAEPEPTFVAKPAPKFVTKPLPKLEPKPEPVPTPELKPEPKPEVNPERKPVPKPEKDFIPTWKLKEKPIAVRSQTPYPPRVPYDQRKVNYAPPMTQKKFVSSMPPPPRKPSTPPAPPPPSALQTSASMSTAPSKTVDDWPVLDIPDDYEDEHPDYTRVLLNARKKFHPLQEDETPPTASPFDTARSYTSEFSVEVGDMGTEDAKFEAGELVEYRDRSWCIAVPISTERSKDRPTVTQLLYSYQRGVDRLELAPEQLAELKCSLLVKYRPGEGNRDTEIVPIYSALPSTGLMSLKYRHNKGIELRVYGIVSFVDFVKDPYQMNHRTMVWTDALGPVYFAAAERSNIRRRLMTTEESAFAPLRLCQMTVKGDFTLTVPNGSVPKWTVTSYQPLIEEGAKNPNMGRLLWPARVLRFDDLIMTKEPASDTDCWFHSSSEPELVKVLACPALFGIINSAGADYARKGVMSGYVVPVFNVGRFQHYEALILGPLRVVMILTEGRGLNYCPKTWPPSMEAKRAWYRKECEKHRAAAEKMRRIHEKRSFEFEFDLKM